MPAPVVVYDLEYTAWEGSQARGWSLDWEDIELVQIGAVRLDADLEETNSLDLVIRPVKNPILSDYFTKLTGITQKRLDGEGIGLAEAMERLSDFAGDRAALLANGPDHEWLAYNCWLQHMACPLPPQRFRNISLTLRQALGRDKHVCSSDLPKAAGRQSDLPAHDGLADARAIALGLRALRETAPVRELLAGL